MMSFKPKAKFNFLTHRKTPTEMPDKDAGTVRVRGYARDRYEGLRGRDYIQARQLDAPLSVQTSAQKRG